MKIKDKTHRTEATKDKLNRKILSSTVPSCQWGSFLPILLLCPFELQNYVYVVDTISDLSIPKRVHATY